MTCNALLVRCIDFRLATPIYDFLEKKNLINDCDVLSIAGATKNIATGSELALKQVDISVNLHNISEIYLVNHTDCGAYGGREAFQSAEKETEKHAEDLKTAKQLLQSKYEDLTIKTYLAEIKESQVKIKEI